MAIVGLCLYDVALEMIVCDKTRNLYKIILYIIVDNIRDAKLTLNYEMLWSYKCMNNKGRKIDL